MPPSVRVQPPATMASHVGSARKTTKGKSNTCETERLVVVFVVVVVVVFVGCCCCCLCGLLLLLLLLNGYIILKE